ncbi:MAG TPA: hypothetical protein VE621_23210 [Bryobacteraceae bacterium]|jgi:hypothetical protein|nr:hypothetical protein [Bryobacteraceae bacterium]
MDQTSPKPFTRVETAAAAILVLLALGVRFYLSVITQFNPDEFLHLISARAGEYNQIHHPPLLLWWLRYASSISMQDWWLRLLPTLTGSFLVLVFGLWLRRFVHPFVAWSAAGLIAVSPNLVVLTPQLRGYPMAMFFSILALFLLDVAFEKRSPWLMLAHLASLILAALSAFPVAFLVLGSGLYALWRFWEWKEVRRLFPLWAAGQVVCLVMYVWLYEWIVKPMSQQVVLNSSMRDGYLKKGFPTEGYVLEFVVKVIPKQMMFIFSSIPTSMVMTALAVLGFVYLLRKDPARLAVFAGTLLIVVAAIAGVHPVAPTRHTSVITIIVFAAVAAGHQFIHMRMPRVSWLVPIGVLGLAIATAQPDGQNVWMQSFEKPMWQRAFESYRHEVKAGDVILADFESELMLGTDQELQRETPRVPRMNALAERHGQPVMLLLWDWSGYIKRADYIREKIRLLKEKFPNRRIWLVDTGFDAWGLAELQQKLGLQPVIEQPKFLYLARVPGTGFEISSNSSAEVTRARSLR